MKTPHFLSLHGQQMLSIDNGNNSYSCLIYDKELHMVYGLPFGSTVNETIRAVDLFIQAFNRTLLWRESGSPWPGITEQLWLPGLEPKPKASSKPKKEVVTLEDLGL